MGESVAFAAWLRMTVSAPTFKILPANIWKFLITPKRAIPAGPEKTAMHLFITKPEAKITTWKPVVEEIPAKLDKSCFLILICFNLLVDNSN